MDEIAQRIVSNRTSYSIAQVVKFILDKKVKVEDFPANDEKDKRWLAALKTELTKRLKDKWKEVEASNSVLECRKYLDEYEHTGVNVEEARNFLITKDEEQWEKVMDTLKAKNISHENIAASVDKYKELFPENVGIHYDECKNIMDDIPWFQTKANNTRKDYENYRKQHPGEHEEEIIKAIEQIDDDVDWNTAVTNGSVDAYQKYLNKHPNGRHVAEAQYRINNRDAKDILLDELQEDPNSHSVEEINKTIYDTAGLNHSDLLRVFNIAQVAAIENYVAPNQLPTSTPSRELPRGYTEVYFWGLRGTGKTCAIGATIGYLSNIRRSLTPHRDNPPEVDQYIEQLQMLFNMGGQICMLPPRTVTGNLPAMSFSFNEKRSNDPKDKNKMPKEHRVTLIDVAGEVFAGIFKQSRGTATSREEDIAIAALKKCLKDEYNNKIHFFIVEYNDDSILEIPGYGRVHKSQVMKSLAEFFNKEEIFNDSAVSLNLLVTKCDRIREGDRMEQVKQYVENSGWGVAAEGINNISVNARTGCMYGMGFSIGEVFAQDLCIFCPDDAEAIVTEIEERTYAYSNTWMGKLIDWFRH